MYPAPVRRDPFKHFSRILSQRNAAIHAEGELRTENSLTHREREREGEGYREIKKK